MDESTYLTGEGEYTMSNFDRALNRVVTSAPTVFGSSTLTTSPVKVTLVAATGPGKKVIKITNLHASNLLAWTIVDKGAAAPTVNATLGNASCGVIVGPGQSEQIVLGEQNDLYVVASAASTTMTVSSFMVG